MSESGAFILGLDLGQREDFTALSLLEQTRPDGPEGEAHYACKHLRRWQQGTPYTAIIKDVVEMAAQLPGVNLAIDGTGCGRPVVDMFRESCISACCSPITITAGNAVSRGDDGYWHVAKVELVGLMQRLLQTRRLKFAQALALRQVAEKELANFSVKITAAANETFASWREGQHDDIVLSVAMAAWLGENRMTGPWTVPLDRGSRSVFEDVPEGVFLDGGPGSFS